MDGGTWTNFLEPGPVESEGGCLIEKLPAAGALIYAAEKEYNVSGSAIGFSDQLAVKAKLSVCRGGLNFPSGAKLRRLAIG